MNMSLVENLINQISTQGLGGITSPHSYNLNDDTFSKLLEKQLNSTNDMLTNNFVGNMGMPAGLMIEPIESADFAEKVQDQLEVIGENNLSKDEYINQPIEFKEINMDDYFSNLLKTSTDNQSDFMNFARKNATNHYQVFSKNFVFDTRDFIQDVLTS